MVEIGQVAIVAAFMVTAYAGFVGFAGGALNGRDLATSARWGFYSVVPLLLIATASLIYAFVNNDFSVKYVAENSNLAMPRIYAPHDHRTLVHRNRPGPEHHQYGPSPMLAC